MAQKSSFFNAQEIAPGEYDRKYQASDFADYFGSVLSTGLLHTDNIPGMHVEVEAGTLNTIVSSGMAIMKGYRYENTTPLTLTHSIPEATMDRIDRIVLRLDLRNSERNVLLHVKEGLPAETPTAPELQRDNFIHEISLASVKVRQNTVQLLASDLIDERLDTKVCGIVHSLISIPTDQLQQFIETKRRDLGVEIDTASEQIKADMLAWEKQWTDWFSSIQGQTFVTGAELNQKIIETSETLTKTIPRLVELESYKMIRSEKDDEGTFKVVEYRRKSDNVLVAKSVLSGGIAPLYTTKTVTYYNDDGLSIAKTDIFTLLYDENGDLIGEV